MAQQHRLVEGLLYAVVVCAPAFGQIGTLANVSGRIVDMTTDSAGRILYCTNEMEVGRVTTAGAVTILANSATGPFANNLRGVVETASGDVTVLDSIGDLYRLPSGTTPAVKIFTDFFMVNDPTDLAIDGAGNYVICSSTPTSFVRAVNWVSADGSRWAYYLVNHTPLAVCNDPSTGKMLLSDSNSGGAIRLVDIADESHPTSPLETTAFPGFNTANNDGDLAPEASGNILYIAGGKLMRLNRLSGTSATLASGLGQLRGLTIAASSGSVPSASGWSAYVAEGNGPTAIREVGNVGAPASVVIPSLGTVPSRGIQQPVAFGLNCYDMTTDTNGDLLIGGDLFGVNQAIKRIALPSLTVTTIANTASGLLGQVTGLCCLPSGEIHALISAGQIQKITEGPFTLSTVYADSPSLIGIGEDLIVQRDGNYLVANRTGFNTGNVLRVPLSGTPTALVNTQESRGIELDPITGQAMVVQWHNSGFVGSVSLLNTTNNTLTPIPGFSGMNYSNGGVWADGDLVEDCLGNVYTCSEDDFSVHRFNRYTGKLVRIGSGYVNRPAGVAIARSTPGSGSTTGWSLYVAEYFYLWEIPSVAAPAPKNWIDTNSPGVGRGYGYLPSSGGTPRAIVADPTGNGLLVSTSNSRLYRVNGSAGAAAQVAGTTQGLSGDLTGLAVRPTGRLAVGSRSGVLYEVDPTSAFATTVSFTNAPASLSDVRSLVVDGLGRTLVTDRPAGSNAGRFYRVSGGTATLLHHTNRGIGSAIDPLTGDVFVSELGTAAENGGEILRIDELSALSSAGHFRGSSYTTFRFDTFDGDLAFDASGNFYVAAGAEGRVYRIDRTTGTRTVVGGNYTQLSGLALAPGTPGVAGAQGTSLFVLDGFAIYEIGVSGLPAGSAPSSHPGLAPPADLRVSGIATLGAAHPVAITSATDANRLYLIVPSLSGKLPGFFLGSSLDPGDTRTIPNNPDSLWSYVNVPSIFPDFFGSLDGAGLSAPTAAIVLPNDPAILGLNQFVDLAWISLDPLAISGIATIGGTAQLYLGN